MKNQRRHARPLARANSAEKTIAKQHTVRRPVMFSLVIQPFKNQAELDRKPNLSSIPSNIGRRMAVRVAATRPN